MSDNRDDRPRGPGRGGSSRGGPPGRGGSGRGFGKGGDRPRGDRPGGDRAGKPGGFGGKGGSFKAGGGKPGRFQRDDRPRPPRDGDERRPPRGERPEGGRERHGGERHGGGRGHDFGRRPGDERGFKPRQDRSGEPRRDFADRSSDGTRGGDRPFRRPEGKPGFARSGAPGGQRPGFKPRFDRPRSERPYGERPRNDRPFRKTVSGEAFDAPREDGLDRVSKIMARAGVASRRDAEAMIEAGRVALNGEAITEPGTVAGPHDVILVDGQPLPAKEKTRLWLYHKPAGLVTTAHDPEGRPTVFDNLPEGLPRVVSVGRLDINTEGLLLLTNDGGLAQVLAHPKTGWLRRYRVRAHGQIDASDLERLADGIEVDGMHYGPIEARIDRVQGDNIWLTLGLREGKNREVKRVLEHLGLQVNRLIRVSFGPFQLGEMEEGQAEEVRTRILRDQLGPELTRAAEADFDLPAVERLREGFHSEHEARLRDERPRDERPRQDRPRHDPPRHDSPRPERPRGDRPRHDRRPDDRDARPSGPREVLERGGRNQPQRSVWRDVETETARPHAGKKPRRGEDPAADRAARADRPRTRAGKVESPSGRAVLVERVAGTDPSGDGRLFRKAKGATQRDPARDRDERAPRSGGFERGGRDRDGQDRGKGGFGKDGSGKGGSGKGGFGPRGGRDERPGGGFKGKPGGGRPPRDRDGAPRGEFRGGGSKDGGFKGGGFKGGRSGGGGRPPGRKPAR